MKHEQHPESNITLDPEPIEQSPARNHRTDPRGPWLSVFLTLRVETTVRVEVAPGGDYMRAIKAAAYDDLREELDLIEPADLTMEVFPECQW